MDEELEITDIQSQYNKQTINHYSKIDFTPAINGNSNELIIHVLNHLIYAVKCKLENCNEEIKDFTIILHDISAYNKTNNEIKRISINWTGISNEKERSS